MMKKPDKKKKVILTVFCIMCFIGVVSFLLLYVFPDVLTPGENDSIAEEMGYEFYPVDYEIDIDSLSAYRELNRYVNYTYGAETFAVTDEDAAEYGDDVLFFTQYFNCLKNGEYENYSSFFTENYIKKGYLPKKFTKQMIYDISVEKLSETDTALSYNVSYKIFHNNGTFRSDIPSDKSRVQYIELIKKDGKYLIDAVKYYNY